MHSLRLRQWVVYPFQALGFVVLYGFFWALPVTAASAVAGWLARNIGPNLGISKRAARNIERALPGIAKRQVANIVRGMWDNLGRVTGEYPHIKTLTDPGNRRVEIIDEGNAARIKDEGARAIMFSAHLANWEVFALSLKHYGLDYAQVFRAPNNPLVDRLIRRIRRLSEEEIIPKGTKGARKALEILGNNGRIGMLVDQKLNDGIAVPFFGREAMTAPATAQFALRYRCPLIPVRLERLDGANFRLTFLPPLELPDSGDHQADVMALMVRINAIFEEWIRERPEQWLWLHRRWPD